jgi:hypothetical protein
VLFALFSFLRETTDLVVESGKHGIPGIFAVLPWLGANPFVTVSSVSCLIEHAIFAPWPHRGYHPAAERCVFLSGPC